MAVTYEANVQLFDGEARDCREQLPIKIWNRHITQSAADAAEKMLVTADICVEAAHSFGRAHAANKTLLFEELEGSVHRCLRKPGDVPAKTIIY